MASNIDDIFAVDNPILYILSDSRGETALAVVYAAAAQFPDAPAFESVPSAPPRSSLPASGDVCRS